MHWQLCAISLLAAGTATLARGPSGGAGSLRIRDAVAMPGAGVADLDELPELESRDLDAIIEARGVRQWFKNRFSSGSSSTTTPQQPSEPAAYRRDLEFKINRLAARELDAIIEARGVRQWFKNRFSSGSSSATTPQQPSEPAAYRRDLDSIIGQLKARDPEAFFDFEEDFEFED